jgi:hypothetical protein
MNQKDYKQEKKVFHIIKVETIFIFLNSIYSIPNKSSSIFQHK